MTTLTVRNMDRATIQSIKEMGHARGWTIAHTIEQMTAAMDQIRAGNDEKPDPLVTALLDETGLNYVRR
jgi:hypothetical protein